MAKYNVGDVLEITEDFELECAVFSEGDRYTIAEVEGDSYYCYYLESDEHDYVNTISKVDTHSGFRKVEPKAEFKVGDKVRLLEGAHSSPGYSCDIPEAVKERLASAGLDYQAVFVVDQKADSDGDVHVSHAEKYVGLYVLPEFLVPWIEEEDKSAEHMELGKTYQSTVNDLFYTPTEFDFEAGRVRFDYKSSPSSIAYKSDRPFYGIEEEFGVLPPVKPENEYTTVTAEEFRKEVQEAKAVAHTEDEQEDVGGWDREEFASAATKPETVSVDALREAWDYVDHEYPDIEKLIKLAKRLS